MQIRPYPEKDGARIWLSKREQRRLLERLEDDYPRRQIAMELGLHGLRSEEITLVEFGGFRPLDAEKQTWAMVVPDGKSGRRSVPVNPDLRKRIKFVKNANRARADDPVVDVATRTMRSWMTDVREELAADLEDDAWLNLTMHDLRRTFATELFYELAIAGVPIAEELTMSVGGWKMTSTGRETFRSHYLGPVPDHVMREATSHFDFVSVG